MNPAAIRAVLGELSDALARREHAHEAPLPGNVEITAYLKAREIRKALVDDPLTKKQLAEHVAAIQEAVEAQLPEDEPDCVHRWVYETAVKVLVERLNCTPPPGAS